MKKLALQLVFVLLGHCVCAQLPIHYLDELPTIDGQSNEWPQEFFRRYRPQSRLAKSTNEMRYALGFDELYLYGIFEVKDAHLTNLANDKSGSPRITFNDGVEFYIDTQNNSKILMEDDDYQLIIDAMGNLTVFRGGDKFLIKVNESKVPKDTMTSHFVMDYQVARKGTVNDETDQDEGYLIEFRVAWAALGVRPQMQKRFKVDICLNDADHYLDIRPLDEEASIPFYDYESISGGKDFGFPTTWQAAALVGEATWWTGFRRTFTKGIGVGLGIVLIVIAFGIWQWKRRFPTVVTIEEKVYRVIAPTDVAADDATLVGKAERFVLQNLQQELSPSDLAEHLNLSLRQLQRQLREEADMTPTDFIRKIKLEKAALWLVSSPKNVAEIAYELGFSDPAYFSRIFKKHFGQTPSEFQENAQKS